MLKKITRYKKKKKNIYEIILSDNTSLSFYDDTILKYDLLVKKEIDDKELKSILEYNNKMDAYYRALNYINKKLRTQKEIKSYLTKYNYTSNIIDEVVTKLKNNEYLNDELYIKSYINDQVNLTLKGPKKILMELEKLGFNTQDINNYLDTFDSNIWEDKIKNIVSKKIQSNHKLSSTMLIKKIKQDLVILGYNTESISSITNNLRIDEDNSIIEKEYNKLYKKIIKKHDKEKVNNLIKYELIRKGFSIDNINNIISQKKDSIT